MNFLSAFASPHPFVSTLIGTSTTWQPQQQQQQQQPSISLAKSKKKKENKDKPLLKSISEANSEGEKKKKKNRRQRRKKGSTKQALSSSEEVREREESPERKTEAPARDPFVKPFVEPVVERTMEKVAVPTRFITNVTPQVPQRVGALKPVSLVGELCHNTAVVITPPDELWEPIQSIRRLDTHHVGIWPPHVTLFHPFYPVEQLAAATDALRQVAANIDPFQIRLANFGNFPQNDKYVTWLSPDPNDSVVSMRQQLHQVVEGCAPAFKQPHSLSLSLSCGW